jgi:hypothetical protein
MWMIRVLVPYCPWAFASFGELSCWQNTDGA